MSKLPVKRDMFSQDRALEERVRKIEEAWRLGKIGSDGGGGGGAPTGAAGGVLGGTYPNPGFAVDMATQAELDAAYALAIARANHTGTQLAATISDFATAVRLNRLDQMAAPTADVSANSHKITNLATPTAGGDAVNKTYADGLVSGGTPNDAMLKGIVVGTECALTVNSTTQVTVSAGPSGVWVPNASGLLVRNTPTSTVISTIPAASASNFRLDQIVISSAGVVSRIAGTQSTTTTLANRFQAGAIPSGSMLLHDLLVSSSGVVNSSTTYRDRRPWALGINLRYTYTGGNITIPAATPAAMTGVRSFRFECTGNPIRVSLLCRIDPVSGVQSGWTSVMPYVDGAAPAELSGGMASYPAGMVMNSGTGPNGFGAGVTHLINPTAGSHLITMYGVGSHAATAYANANQPLTLLFEEIVGNGTDNGSA